MWGRLSFGGVIGRLVICVGVAGWENDNDDDDNSCVKHALLIEYSSWFRESVVANFICIRSCGKYVAFGRASEQGLAATCISLDRATCH